MAVAITVESNISAPVEKVWRYFTEPQHIVEWNHASDDWHSPRATNDLRVGGKFTARMEAKDGSEGFDFEGVYEEVVPQQKIAYHMSDGRHVTTTFATDGSATNVTTTFDPESENTPDVQRSGWQAILDNFKKHVEASE